MTQQRNINPWHLLTLSLAFIAGAATFSNPRWLSHLPFNSSKNESVSASAETLDASLSEAVANEEGPTSKASDNALSEPGLLAAEDPMPEEIPLFLQNEIEDLREQTELAREKIDELEQIVSDLSAEVENGRDPVTDPNATQTTASEQQPVATSNRGRRNRGINRDALVQAGVDASAIDVLEQRQDQQALARLDLLDRAAREGYSGTERLENELNDLRESGPNLQEELGDAAYDQYLFNAGSNNRVRVATIISGSIADLGGVLVGDIIYQYGPTRVFNVRGLVSAIREGVRDEPVVVNLVRDGQPLIIDVTRAPLGVTLNGVREEPF